MAVPAKEWLPGWGLLYKKDKVSADSDDVHLTL